MLKLLKNGEVFAPEYMGKKDILIADGRIAAVEEHISLEANPYIEVSDMSGYIITPGLIDGHVHITGGGGEGSFKTRTPELMLSDCIMGGITTVVGVIGTDGTTRTMANLLAKAKGLTEEGITCYCKSGNYHVPVKTLTGSVETDIIFIQEIIGSGEIAIADHRSSQPQEHELARLASEARIGGILSGKGGVVTIHVGNSPTKLDLLEKVVKSTDIPISQFLPTHINRTHELLEAGINYALGGGYVDLTTSSSSGQVNDLCASKSLKKMLESGVPIGKIMFTSDGQGSLPRFDNKGNFNGLEIGKVISLYDEVRNAYLVEGVPLEEALRVATANPADILKLPSKGRIQPEKDADLMIIDESAVINGVMSKGKWLMKNKEHLVKGTFE
ncbi:MULTISPECIES: beta-aspartyl-peptidase [Bacillaceae]|uniref:Isoaspartyl dipeptidase n=1 Tax=Evansella alkalicola TaxID=745819 RepID=A0ABS6JTX5_9BACI|nr:MULTISPECIES: beta-aspartyl-peptidase [Bacillaceae]MBU9721870.1 beta-aspartyl-peptidase [Bacillus alkalicola]